MLDGRDMLGVRVEEGDSVLHALNLVFSTGEWIYVKDYSTLYEAPTSTSLLHVMLNRFK